MLANNAIEPIFPFLAADSRIDAELAKHFAGQVHAQAMAFAAQSSGNKVDNVFRGLRNRWLRDYKAGSGLADILLHGQFNCVGATAFMALAFEGLGMEVELHEQAQHVFLYVQDGTQRFRIETTAEDFGAIKEAAVKRAEKHSKTISLIELAGLQYYNEGLMALDQNLPMQASNAFAKAAKLYPCTRVAEMQSVAAQLCKERGMQALAESNWDLALDMLGQAIDVAHPDATLDQALAATVLHKAESAATLELANSLLAAYAEGHPALLNIPAFGASLGESYLLLAQARLNTNPRQESAHAYLIGFEKWNEGRLLAVDPDLAAKVYRCAFLDALKHQDNPRAEQCLRMGLSFAPLDASLLAGKMTLAN